MFSPLEKKTILKRIWETGMGDMSNCPCPVDIVHHGWRGFKEGEEKDVTWRRIFWRRNHRGFKVLGQSAYFFSKAWFAFSGTGSLRPSKLKECGTFFEPFIRFPATLLSERGSYTQRDTLVHCNNSIKCNYNRGSHIDLTSLPSTLNCHQISFPF